LGRIGRSVGEANVDDKIAALQKAADDNPIIIKKAGLPPLSG
jgi:hypothetical protein